MEQCDAMGLDSNIREGALEWNEVNFHYFSNCILVAFPWNLKIGSFSSENVFTGILNPICISRD